MDSLIIFVVVFVVFLYIIVPIRIRARMSMSAEPRFEAAEADDPRVPEAAKAFFCDVAAELTPLGFQPAAYLINPETVPDVTGYIAVFERRSARDLAAAMAVFAQAAPTHVTQHYSVEFVNEFTDGTEIDTNNSTSWQWRASLPQQKIWRFPGMGNLAQLYQIHQALAARHSRAAKKPVPPPDEHGAKMRAGFIRDYQRQVAAGFMYLDPTAGRFQHTWKGGMLGTWSQLWPMSMIRRWNTKRRARRLLRELNLPTKYDTVDYQKRFARYDAIPREEPALQNEPSADAQPPPTLVGRCPVCRGSIVIEHPPDASVCCPACQSIVPTPSRAAHVRTSHSGLGIASFALAIVVGLTDIALFVFGATRATDAPAEVQENSLVFAALGLAFLCANALALLGLGVGIGGLVQKTRKRAFAILGVCLNVIILLGITALILIGTMV